MTITKKFYTSQVEYMFNNYIREYDIRKANISILYDKGVISEVMYSNLYNSDRMTRQVFIGKMIKEDSQVGEILANSIMEFKEAFFDANSIHDYDILSIKNDAVFLINKIPRYTKFGKYGGVEFVNKNVYTHFMKLDRLEIYYHKNPDRELIDVKGIKDEDIQKYHMPFLGIILEFLSSINDFGAESALSYINDIINKYVKRELGIEYYRNFRSQSDYLMPTATTAYGIISQPTDYNFDIDYNLYLLRKMQMYASRCLYEKIYWG